MSEFTGIWLPKEILELPDLPFLHKGILAQIISLSREDGYCKATDNYFSTLFQIDVATVNRTIKNLKEKNLILVDVDKKAGNKRVITPTDFLSIAYPQKVNSLPAKSQDPTDFLSIAYPQKVNSLYNDENKDENNVVVVGVSKKNAELESEPEPLLTPTFLSKDLRSDSQALKALEEIFKLTSKQLDEALGVFSNNLILTNKRKTVTDFREHFNNWLRKNNKADEFKKPPSASTHENNKSKNFSATIKSYD